MPEQLQNDPFDYSPHALRLDGRQWLIVLAIVLLFALLAPRIWTKLEPFDPGDDYRIPYPLSADYWLYQRHLREAASDPGAILVIGDSVIWGEYVRPDGSLSHFLSSETGGGQHFVNAGVNGLFPLALEGLLRDYGHSVENRKILLHANLLWMTSPEADLSATKEQTFNHAALVPQFAVRIPCYRAPIDQRLGHLANRKVNLFSWSKHLQICYFDQLGIPAWTLEPGNACKNPLAQVTRVIPAEPADDPDRGETSARHRAWSDGNRQAQTFAWVTPDQSLQWPAFQRLVKLLQSRGNDLLVIVGPFNEHMVTPGNRPPYQIWMNEMRTWLDEQGVPHLSPTVLPSALYGDASHPLTSGYQQLAKEILESPAFDAWLK